MFTTIDKNLLIAAMESAIYHACVTANVVSLHAIETGVSSLRQRFDVDPASVTDAEVFGMVDTIERATIPKLSQISELDNTTNIADRVVSFLWKNILEKPTTFPPSAHAHPWGDISSKPATFPPSEHTHEAAAVTWNDVSDKPTTFPPSEHTHAAQSLPSGAISLFGGAVCPDGWLFCDGSTVSRETYAALFAAIGTTYGSGDGTTTFLLPDFRGRVGIGAGQGSGLTNRTLGETLGEEEHALAANENGTHNGHKGVGTGGMLTPNNGWPECKAESSGLGLPHNTMQPSIVINYIIKV